MKTKPQFCFWFDALPVIVSAGISRLLLHGPPDTGKTTTAGKIGQQRGQSVFRLQCSRDQGIEDLLGQFTLSNGATQFCAGPIPQAMAQGGVLVMDEFDMRNPAHDSIYHSILDEPEIAEVRLPDGSTVKPAKGFLVICTTNAPPNAFTPALLRRWELKLYCAMPHPDALGILPKREAEFLRNVYAKTKTPEFKYEFCVSSFRALRMLIGAGVKEIEAMDLVFGTAAARELESALTSIPA